MPDLVGKRAVYYLVLFVLGFIVIADDAFTESAERHRFAALAIGTVAVRRGTSQPGRWRDSLPDPSVALTAVNYVGMLGVWTMLIGMLGAGRRYLDRPSQSLSYLAEASYPVYILHQTAIVVLAWFVVQRADRRGGAVGRHPGRVGGRELRDLRGRAAGRAATVPVRHAAEELSIDRSARLEQLA